MRIASVLALIAAAGVSLCASAAPANTNVDTSMASVPVNGHTRFPMSQAEISGVQGTYELEDGRTLRVTARQQHVYAELDGARTEVVPVAHNRFASADDAVRLVFNSSVAPTDVKVSTIAH